MVTLIVLESKENLNTNILHNVKKLKYACRITHIHSQLSPFSTSTAPGTAVVASNSIRKPSITNA